jgi:hypothetical protein
LEFRFVVDFPNRPAPQRLCPRNSHGTDAHEKGTEEEFLGSTPTFMGRWFSDEFCGRDVAA